MKLLMFMLFTTLNVAAFSQHSLEKLWETDSVIAIPESVLPDTKNNLLYISLIDGQPWGADDKGGIAVLNPDGTVYQPDWVTGLSAPKGIGMWNNLLYVADISNVVVINIPGKKIEKRIPIEGAQGLNDVTITDSGIVYVSDSRTARIWRIEKDKPALFLENMQGVNGIKAIGDDLIIASGKSFIQCDENKKITRIAELPQGGDGIEPIGNGDYLVTSWAGYIFYVYGNGTVETLLESHKEKRNTADIGYDPEKKIVYVPTFFAKTVAAYKLN